MPLTYIDSDTVRRIADDLETAKLEHSASFVAILDCFHQPVSTSLADADDREIEAYVAKQRISLTIGELESLLEEIHHLV